MVPIAAIAAAAVVTAILAVTLRRYHAEYGMLLSLLAGVGILAALLAVLPDVLAEVTALLDAARLPGKMTVRRRRKPPARKPGKTGKMTARQNSRRTHPARHREKRF